MEPFGLGVSTAERINGVYSFFTALRIPCLTKRMGSSLYTGCRCTGTCLDGCCIGVTSGSVSMWWYSGPGKHPIPVKISENSFSKYSLVRRYGCLLFSMPARFPSSYTVITDNCSLIRDNFWAMMFPMIPGPMAFPMSTLIGSAFAVLGVCT